MHQQTPEGAHVPIDSSIAGLELQTIAKLSISSTSPNAQLVSPMVQNIPVNDDSKTDEDDGKCKYRRSARCGRKWTVTETGCVLADWSICFDLSQIKATLCKYSPLPEIASYTVTYLGEGTGHKVFKVAKADTQPVVMRLALPVVDDGEKTISEQATHDFLCATTKDICVPVIIASCTNASEKDNDVGVEWLLMTYLDGAELGCQWYESKDFEARKDVVKQIAKYHALLYRFRFNRIGSLYPSGNAANPRIGPLIARERFDCPYKLLEGENGPYKNSYDWLFSRLEFASDRIEKTKQAFFDDDELHYANLVEDCIPKLKEVLSKIFNEDEEEEMALFHTDTLANNFVVDEHHHLNGMLDWEYAFCAPLWLACQPPGFLADRRPPMRALPPDSNEFTLENGKKSADYETNKEDWEHGQLLICFVLTVAKAEPAWARAFLDGHLKRSFYLAIQRLHYGEASYGSRECLKDWKNDKIMKKVPETKWLKFHIPGEWEGDGLEKNMTVQDALEVIIARSAVANDGSE